MIDRSKQTAVPTPSSAALRLKRSLRAGASVLALAVAGFGAGMVQPDFAAGYTIDGGRTETVPGSHPSGWQIDSLYVGTNGKGTLIINSGAQVTVLNNIYLGGIDYLPGDIGVITVDGPGSILTVGYDFMVGKMFYGILTITNGGTVSSVRGFINGNVTVEEGSTWANSGYLWVGTNQGKGTLTIRSGGSVSSNGGSIYSGSGVTVDGTGSVWANTGELQMGIHKAGKTMLTVSNNGIVMADDVLLDTYNDNSNDPTSTAINIGAAAGEEAKKAGKLQANTVKFAAFSKTDSNGINFNHTDDNYSFDPSISGGGYINQIHGTTILTGDNSQFRGRVAITGGVMQLGDGGTTGDLGSASINTGTDETLKGVLIFNRSNSMAVSGIISGTGNVVQQGSGTTVLTSDNTYSGGTILDGGTLSVSREANLGDTAGALSFNGGTLQITGTDFQSTGRTITWGSEGGGFDIADAGNVFTVGQNLGAGGALTKKGAGMLVLSGKNTYKGGTTITAGTLQIGTGGASGWIEGDVANDGALVFNRNDAVEFDGNISGTGSVTQDGTGKLTLSGNNSYGDTYLNAGVISVEQEE
ncbi:autotransporter-associated beta strand repeat-containing protein, partial [Brucella intermedia]|uniref:autotransporter-associated beta strand repeat-containing protein n=1 Tax=Brucella intermedia TaxID=94625 RepID=UPI001E4D0C27